MTTLQTKRELKSLYSLSLPLIMAALSQVGIEVVDTIMMGMLGKYALAAGALGTNSFFTVLVMGIGVLTSVSIFVARARGVKDQKTIEDSLHQGLWLSVIMGIPVMCLLYFMPKFLLAIGQDAIIVQSTKDYLYGIVWGVIPAFGFITLREYVSAFERAKIVMFLSLMAIPLDVLFNYILMYGKLGLPEFGLLGIGYASALVEVAIFSGLLFYILRAKRSKELKPSTLFSKPNFSVIIKLARLGWPVGVLFVFEVGLFFVASMMMGYFGEDALAAHQIALQCAVIAFMIPMGISQATAIRVGMHAGADHFRQAQKAGYLGIAFGLALAFFAALIFWFGSYQLVALFIEEDSARNMQVVELAASYLAVAAVFQLVDAVQVIMSGALRGLKDTLVPMWLGLVSYWLIGISSSLLFAYTFDLKGVGVWWGLAVGIFCSALLLFWRFRNKCKKALKAQ